MRIGGDPENYMDPPVLNIGGGDSRGGAGSFIAGVLDLLGIHRQVAKGPKPKDLASDSAPDFKRKEDESGGKKGKKSKPKPKVDVLGSVDSAVTRIPMTSPPANPFAPLGLSPSQVNRPITTIDPNTLY